MVESGVFPAEFRQRLVVEDGDYEALDNLREGPGYFVAREKM